MLQPFTFVTEQVSSASFEQTEFATHTSTRPVLAAESRLEDSLAFLCSQQVKDPDRLPFEAP